MRYVVANLLYRLRFPRGWLRGVDFRPHFDGHLINAVVTIPTGLDEAAIESALSLRLKQSYQWMRKLRFFLRKGDRVQFCLGTIEPRQQYLKAWSSWEDLAEGVEPRDIAEYWRDQSDCT